MAPEKRRLKRKLKAQKLKQDTTPQGALLPDISELDELKQFVCAAKGSNTFEQLLSTLKQASASLTDNRAGRGNHLYSMVAAFSVFMFQNPSFLEHQRRMHTAKGINNFTSIFGVEKIPSDNQVRNVLDGVSASELSGVFESSIKVIKDNGILNSQFCTEEFGTLVSLDGTRYFQSEKISCKNCNTKKHSNGKVEYFHSAVTPVIVAPGNQRVIPMFPEFNSPQDGSTKQDCEIEASKRIISQNRSLFTELNATFLGDDLYSREPFCKLLLESGFNFILTSKPDSHVVITNLIEELEDSGGVSTYENRVKQKRGNKFTTERYRFVNNIPIKGGRDCIDVNWVEVSIFNNKEKLIYKSSFITNLKIAQSNVVKLVQAARARWKVENENNNTLKTKGYNLEHNFGHGEENLSQVFATLNILAFLFHTILELSDESFFLLREVIEKRTTFFEHIKALTVYLCFNSMTSLKNFMLLSLGDHKVDISISEVIRLDKFFDSG